MKRLALALSVLVGLTISPAAAQAVVPGPNGPIVFTSGRADGAQPFGDGNAQIWLIQPSGGIPQRLTFGVNLRQHRHATWSPDRKMIAYARCATDGCGGGGPWQIVIQNLQTGTRTPITSAADFTDRPSFSPDGTRIAYGRRIGATDWDVFTQPVNGGAGGVEAPVAVSTDPEEKPAWSADSQTIFYQRLVAASNRDVYASPSGGGLALPVIATTDDDYQPGVSPGGDNLCFVRGLLGTDNAEVKRATVAGGSITDVSPVDGVGSYNCVWSPDSTKIAYANGTFGKGALVRRSSDGTGAVTTIADCPGTTCFDGNPDWTYNPRPACSGRTVSVGFNESVSIPLVCSDAPDPPSFSPHHVVRAIASVPAHGTLGAIAGDETVTYTPNTNFTGTDSFSFRGSDGTSSSAAAAVTIDVVPTSPAKASFMGSKSSIRVNRKRRFKFTFHSTPGLTGKAVFASVKKVRVSRKRKRKVTLARKSFKVPDSGKVTLRIKLSKKNFRILKRNKKIRTRVTVTLKNALGLKSTAKKRITLKAPKRKRHRR